MGGAASTTSGINMCDFDIFFFFFLVLFPVSLLGREGRYQDIDRERHSRKRGRRDMSDKEDRGWGLLGRGGIWN